jgi:hypothetical protein
LTKDPEPASQPPTTQAIQALNLVNGAAKLSKKQLQRVKKFQAQEAQELVVLQNAVGMQNVPQILQTYWEAKGETPPDLE